jgi:sporulation protein YlmC with PRC-barrel domain
LGIGDSDPRDRPIVRVPRHLTISDSGAEPCRAANRCNSDDLAEEVEMSKLSTAATLAAILAAAAPAAFAQSSVTTPNRTETTGTVSHMGIQPDQIRASKMIGSTVYDVQNRSIGKVADLVLDKAGRVDEVVIDVGSFLGVGGKDIAVKISDIKTDNNRLTLDRTKEQLQQMASYQLENRNTGAGTSTSPVTGGQLGR